MFSLHSHPSHRFFLFSLLFLSCVPFVVNADGVISTYRNPVIAGDIPDPSVIRVGDVYYAAGTCSDWGPYYPLFESKDLVNWEPIGYAFQQTPSWANVNYWAPELFYYKDTFYLYYTARRAADGVSCIGVATTDDIHKGFIDRGIIVDWGKEAIDAFLLLDDDGKLYITWKAYGLDRDKKVSILGSELTPDGLSLTGEHFTLLEADGDSWERGGIEGQSIFQRDGYYYTLYSGAACCGRGCDYSVGVARSKSFRGPWEKCEQNPILTGDSDFRCPGHGTVVADSFGQYFYLYHAYQAQDFVYLGRQGMLDKLAWKDGWPYFEYGNHPSIQAPMPCYEGMQNPLPNFVDRFDGSDLDFEWIWDYRHKPDFQLADGKLRPIVTDESADAFCGSVLAMRPKKGDLRIEAKIESRKENAAGLTAYGNAENAVALGVRGNRLVLSHATNGKARTLSEKALPERDSYFLRMDVRDGYLCVCYWSLDGSQWNLVSDDFHKLAYVNASNLPSWERGYRIGIFANGKTGDEGIFDSVEVKYDSGHEREALPEYK